MLDAGLDFMENGAVNMEQLLTLIGILTGLALGVLNWTNAKKRGDSANVLEQSQAIQNLNTSIELANERALKAEQRALAAESVAEQLEKRILVLESEFKEKMSYRLIFDVILGSSPVIQKSDISPLFERRKENAPVIHERRKN